VRTSTNSAGFGLVIGAFTARDCGIKPIPANVIGLRCNGAPLKKSNEFSLSAETRETRQARRIAKAALRHSECTVVSDIAVDGFVVSLG
jgi:hypothetical protein